MGDGMGDGSIRYVRHATMELSEVAVSRSDSSINAKNRTHETAYARHFRSSDLGQVSRCGALHYARVPDHVATWAVKLYPFLLPLRRI